MDRKERKQSREGKREWKERKGGGERRSMSGEKAKRKKDWDEKCEERKKGIRKGERRQIE